MRIAPFDDVTNLDDVDWVDAEADRSIDWSKEYKAEFPAKPLTFNEYQRRASETSIYPLHAGLYYTALGLAGEAGEVAGKVSKVVRDDNGVLTEEKRAAIMDELSDVLWFLGACATEAGYTLEEVAAHNLVKVYRRLLNGTLVGSGDR